MDWASAAKRLLRRLRHGGPRLHEDWRILEQVGRRAGRHVVLDVGAHHGWFLRWWKVWCPEAEIHAFEPALEAAAYLETTFGEDVVVNRVGVSDAEGTAKLHVMAEMSPSSSFLEPIRQAWNDLEIPTGDVTTVEVPITTIDAYGAAHDLGSIFLIKLDVQGYELKALRGAEQTLPHVEHLLVESSVTPMYDGAPVFTEVHSWLSTRGFRLLDLSGWKDKTGAMVEVDMLYRGPSRRTD